MNCRQCNDKMKKGFDTEDGFEYPIWYCDCGYWCSRIEGEK